MEALGNTTHAQAPGGSAGQVTPQWEQVQGSTGEQMFPQNGQSPGELFIPANAG